LKLIRCQRSFTATLRSFALITRTALVLAPATLAALPSTRATPGRAVFYVAHPIRSIQLFSVSVFQPFLQLPLRRSAFQDLSFSEFQLFSCRCPENQGPTTHNREALAIQRISE
jgi:hypothetical protein